MAKHDPLLAVVHSLAKYVTRMFATKRPASACYTTLFKQCNMHAHGHTAQVHSDIMGSLLKLQRRLLYEMRGITLLIL
jgi:hypothetical protein